MCRVGCVAYGRSRSCCRRVHSACMSAKAALIMRRPIQLLGRLIQLLGVCLSCRLSAAETANAIV